MKSILGKIANVFKISNTWTKGRDFNKDTKIAIEAAYKRFVDPAILELMTRASYEDLQVFINRMVQDGLGQINKIACFISIHPDKVPKVNIAYMLLYIFVKNISLFQTTDKSILNAYASIVQFLIETLIQKYNKNVQIEMAGDSFEIQREERKQAMINTMKNMNSSDRELIKQMKERGLVNMMDLADGVIQIGGQAEEDIYVVNEADHEIGNDILNNLGEDGDYDN